VSNKSLFNTNEHCNALIYNLQHCSAMHCEGSIVIPTLSPIILHNVLTAGLIQNCVCGQIWLHNKPTDHNSIQYPVVCPGSPAHPTRLSTTIHNCPPGGSRKSGEKSTFDFLFILKIPLITFECLIVLVARLQYT
jgi:hypothetical protein